MRFKEGVKVNGIKPELWVALHVADQVYTEHGADLVVTSVKDGKHSRGSLHYIGHAGDLRTRGMDKQVVKLMRDEIAGRLTDEYDIIIEENHLHAEHQPKE